jgi:hypothetical protein
VEAKGAEVRVGRQMTMMTEEISDLSGEQAPAAPKALW